MLIYHKVSGQVMLEKLDVGVSSGCGEQRTLYLSPSQVRGMDDTAVIVASFAGQVQAAILIAGKVSSHADQFEHACWALSADHLHSSDRQAHSGRQQKILNFRPTICISSTYIQQSLKSLQECQTHLLSLRKAPATIVSRTWSWTESDWSRTAQTPPWAY